MDDAATADGMPVAVPGSDVVEREGRGFGFRARDATE